MTIENLKSFDPFADEGDPFAESADAADAHAADAATDALGGAKSEAAPAPPASRLKAPDVASTSQSKAPDVAPTSQLKTPDPKDADALSFPYEDSLAADVGSTLDHLHIRIQQRNGRKTLTTLQGLPKEYNEKKLLKAFKKEFACNGTVIDDEKAGKIIQLQGDQRSKMTNFLVDEGVEKDIIKVHGF